MNCHTSGDKFGRLRMLVLLKLHASLLCVMMKNWAHVSQRRSATVVNEMHSKWKHRSRQVRKWAKMHPLWVLCMSQVDTTAACQTGNAYSGVLLLRTVGALFYIVSVVVGVNGSWKFDELKELGRRVCRFFDRGNKVQKMITDRNIVLTELENTENLHERSWHA